MAIRIFDESVAAWISHSDETDCEQRRILVVEASLVRMVEHTNLIYRSRLIYLHRSVLVEAIGMNCYAVIVPVLDEPPVPA